MADRSDPVPTAGWRGARAVASPRVRTAPPRRLLVEAGGRSGVVVEQRFRPGAADRGPADVELPQRSAGRRAGDANDRPAVVLVHGIGMSGRYFGRLAPVLALTHEVHVLNLPGYGSSPKPPQPFTVPELADALRGAIRALGLLSPVLLGHSMGSQVVAEAVAADPSGVAGYVLVGPTVDVAARSVLHQAARLARDCLRSPVSTNLLVTTDYARMGPGRYLHTVRFMLAHHIEEAITGCTAPGLIVRGAGDVIAPAGWVQRLAALAPDASWREVPDAPHNVQHVRPGALAAACAPFLDALPRRLGTASAPVTPPPPRPRAG